MTILAVVGGAVAGLITYSIGYRTGANAGRVRASIDFQTDFPEDLDKLMDEARFPVDIEKFYGDVKDTARVVALKKIVDNAHKQGVLDGVEWMLRRSGLMTNGARAKPVKPASDPSPREVM